MNQTSVGWVLFIASIGSMCTLLAVDIAKLGQWGDVWKPEFVGLFMAHVGTVITAFIGGKLIPPDRDGKRTRSTDDWRDDQ